MEESVNYHCGDLLLDSLDFLDLDEEFVDEKITKFLNKPDLSNRQLKILIHLIKYKHMISMHEESDCENSHLIDFTVKNLINIKDSSEQRFICLLQLLSLCLELNKEKILSNLEHLFQQILSEINVLNKNLTTDDVAQNICFLKIIDCLTNVCITNKLKTEFLFISKEIIKLLDFRENSINLHLYSNTIPNIIICFNNYSILNSIYNKVITTDEDGFNGALFLCILSDFYFPIEKYKSQIKSLIFRNVSFWKFIQNGLFGEDDSVRKCSTFLLKRAIDYVMENNSDIVVFQDGDPVPFFVYNIQDKSNFEKIWHRLFVIIESIEEKQFHLVESALNLLADIKILHPSWYNCILKKTLIHESNSIVKLSLIIALKSEVNYAFSFKNLLYAMNKISLYENFFKKESYLKNTFLAFLNKDQNFKIFFDNIREESLSPIPRYFLSYMIKLDYNVKSENELIQLLNAFIPENGYKQNDRIIEYGTQCCLFDVFVRNISKVTEARTMLLLLTKFSNDILCRNTIFWNRLVNAMKITNCSYISVYLNSNENIFFSCDSISVINLLILSIDASLYNIENFVDLLNLKLSQLKNCNQRIYANANEFDSNFSFLMNCLNVIGPQNVSLKKCDFEQIKDDNLHNLLILYLSNNIDLFIDFIFMKLRNVSYDNIQIVDKVIDDFGIFICHPVLSEFFYQKAESILFFIENTIKSNDVNHLMIYFSIKLLSKLCLFICTNDFLEPLEKNKNLDLYFKIVKNIQYLKVSDKSSCVVTGNTISAYNEAVCKIIYYYYANISDKSSIIDFYEYINELLDSGGCLLWAIKLLSILLLELCKKDDYYDTSIGELLNKSWKEIMCIRKNEKFWKCVDEYIRAVFTEEIISKNKMIDIVRDTISRIMELSETASYAMFLLMNQILSVYKNSNASLLVDIVFESLIHGNVLRKDQRIELDIYEFIAKNNSLLSFSNMINICANQLNKTREIGLEILINKNSDFHLKIRTLSMEKINNICKTKQRYHANSLNHRMLMRTLQIIIFSYKYVSESVDHNEHINWCINLLISQPHHYSIKILLEWMISIHLIKSNISLLNASKLFNFSKLPTLSSFMIIYHVVKYQLLKLINSKSDDDLVWKNFNFAIDTYLPFTMGQTFNIRLYSQYLIVKLLSHVEIDEYKNKYELINSIINNNFITYAEEKNFNKIQNEFYINNFDIIENLDMGTIFLHIPRLTGVVKDEWITETFVKKHVGIICNEEFQLSKIKDYINDSNECVENKTTMIPINIQKKFVPWKTMLIDMSITVEKDNTDKNNLIVVASLIDRIPNLGGLCRTCEVFGVEQYVINSLRYLQDKQFQNLSVSSEQWVNIKEVQPGPSLVQFLVESKERGYKIIGAEQTSSSISLDKFCFPQKSVLILGHEKEGIPPSLLNILDYCVEIPQKGLVRSLNVHVTASIFIWEYMRQHNL